MPAGAPAFSRKIQEAAWELIQVLAPPSDLGHIIERGQGEYY